MRPNASAYAFIALHVVATVAGCAALEISIPSSTAPAAHTPSASDRALAQRILAEKDLDLVLARARALLASGLNAGSTYSEVWIRDFATFMTVSCDVNDRRAIRDALLTVARFQRDDGDIPDGVGLRDTGKPPTDFAPSMKPATLRTRIRIDREVIESDAAPE